MTARSIEVPGEDLAASLSYESDAHGLRGDGYWLTTYDRKRGLVERSFHSVAFIEALRKLLNGEGKAI